MRTTKELVIKTASDIADRDGLSGLSLKAVAETLGLRTPSLYNHIGSLEELLLEAAHAGMREMNRLMTQAAVGVSGDEAVRAAALAYLRYMTVHPGVYEIIQWAGWHQSGETAGLLEDYRGLLEKLVRSCVPSLSGPEPAVRLLSGFLHGWTTQQLGAAINAPAETERELLGAVDTVLLGLHKKYD